MNKLDQLPSKKILSLFMTCGFPNLSKSKKVFDTWKFSKDSRSNNPNWLLTDTQI